MMVTSLAYAFDVGAPDRHDIIAVGHRIAQIVEHAVLEKDHRVVVADGGCHQALGIGRRRRHHDFQAGNVNRPGMQALRMLRSEIAADADGRAHDQRHAELAGRHVIDLGRLIDQLVHDQRDEIAEHHLEHRPLPGHGGANRDAEGAGFRDRRIDHALAAELREQPFGLLEHAAGGADVLAHHDDRVIDGAFRRTALPALRRDR